MHDQTDPLYDCRRYPKVSIHTTWQGKSGASVLVTLLLPRGNDSFDDGTGSRLPSDGEIGFEARISDTKLHSKATATATPQRIGEDLVRTISQLTVHENHPQ